jgi:hypothetical protein
VSYGYSEEIGPDVVGTDGINYPYRPISIALFIIAIFLAVIFIWKMYKSRHNKKSV